MATRHLDEVPTTIKFVYKGKLGSGQRQGFNLFTIGKSGDGALYAAMEFTGEAIDNLSMDGRSQWQHGD